MGCDAATIRVIELEITGPNLLMDHCRASELDCFRRSAVIFLAEIFKANIIYNNIITF